MKNLEITNCMLNKAPHALNQSLRAWFRSFTKVMPALGHSQGDHTLFAKRSTSGGNTT